MELVFAKAGNMDIWTIVFDLVARTKPIQQPATPPPPPTNLTHHLHPRPSRRLGLST